MFCKDSAGATNRFPKRLHLVVDSRASQEILFCIAGWLTVALALIVYNRLSIYVNFNGMTRMQTVGLLGMTSVLVGFLLVVRKISKGHDFRWLVRRSGWWEPALLPA